jgi:hypothetical protein
MNEFIELKNLNLNGKKQLRKEKEKQVNGMGLGRLVLFGFVVVAFFKMEKRRE